MNAVTQEALAAAERILALLDIPRQITSPDGAPALAVSEGEIMFDGIGFSYGKDTRVLDDINFQAGAGQTVALVGPSGAGKTTVINLLPRFFDATQGSILIDGQDISTVTTESLRRNIALVGQDAILFDDTVAANIAFGRLGASRTEIETAARAAAAHEFIAELPNGYDTEVGAMGNRLSGGQRQRISIAGRCSRTPILLLDEATAALTRTQKSRCRPLWPATGPHYSGGGT